MACAESRLHAYFDGEMGAIAAAEFERHLDGCADCRAALAQLGELRAALRRELPFVSTPPGLAVRIATALERESSGTMPPAPATAPSDPPVPRDSPWDRTQSRRDPRRFWWGALCGAGATALAAAMAFFALTPGVDPLLSDLVNAHVRSLMPSHLIDVESSDRHTVKPWFAGHADVSPVVIDFAAAGYRLVGGRTDYFDGQRAAVVVYQHGAHVINAFSWADARGSLPRDTTRNGYHLAFWRSGNLLYCAVSDTGWDELLRLESLMRGVDIARPAEPSGQIVE
jgi:anti-sigma factor RsiW